MAIESVAPLVRVQKMSAPRASLKAKSYLKCVPELNPDIRIPSLGRTTVAILTEMVNEMYERFALAVENIQRNHTYEIEYLKGQILEITDRLGDLDRWDEQAEFNLKKNDEVKDVHDLVNDLQKPTFVFAEPTPTSPKNLFNLSSPPAHPRATMKPKIPSKSVTVNKLTLQKCSQENVNKQNHRYQNFPTSRAPRQLL